MEGKALWLTEDFGDLKRIVLMLGPACNFRCRHCLQMPDKDVGASCSVVLADKVWGLLVRFIRCALGNKGMKRSVLLWGGEPLMYWDTVKEIIERTDRECHWNGSPFFMFTVITNGSLLTEEKVEFFNRYNVHVPFSYDAPYPFAARDYVSDDICRLADRLKHGEISSNPCSYNMDVLLTMKCLRAKFPHLAFNDGTPFILRRTFDMPKDLYAFDWENVGKIVRKLFIGAKLGDRDALNILRTFVLPAVLNRDERKNDVPICRARRKQLYVTVDGKVSVCYNKTDVIGTLDDTLSRIWEKYFVRISEAYVNPECEGCEHNDVCDGFCLIEIRDKDGKSVTCREFRRPFWEIVKKELARLGEPPTESEVVWYSQQEKAMERQVQMFLREGKRYEVEHTRFPKDMA